jgi:putative hydrolases of HD superfamily
MKNTSAKLQNILEFLHVSEGLKKLLRHSWLSDGRQESVAEHSWRMALMAMAIHPLLETPVDIEKVLQMITLHDLAEVKAGDYHAFDQVPSNKHELEEKALSEIVENLENNSGEEFFQLWNEFEEGVTEEAKFAQALDKLEVLIQHNDADISTWNETEYSFNLTYADNKVAYSRVLSLFRELIRDESKVKIAKAKK